MSAEDPTRVDLDHANYTNMRGQEKPITADFMEGVRFAVKAIGGAGYPELDQMENRLLSLWRRDDPEGVLPSEDPDDGSEPEVEVNEHSSDFQRYLLDSWFGEDHIVLHRAAIGYVAVSELEGDAVHSVMTDLLG